MSDDQQLFTDDEGGSDDMSGGRKVGFLPGLALKILKYAALLLAAVIFIVTVVVITNNIMNRGAEAQSIAPASKEYEGHPPIYQWYSQLGEVRGRTSDETPYTFIVEPVLGYEKDNKQVESELIQRTPLLKDLVRSYFSKKKARELSSQHEEEIKVELREKINSIMRQGKVQKVAFHEFQVLEF